MKAPYPHHPFIAREGCEKSRLSRAELDKRYPIALTLCEHGEFPGPCPNGCNERWLDELASKLEAER